VLRQSTGMVATDRVFLLGIYLFVVDRTYSWFPNDQD
jgi:hypothetical protein